jgi:hypothetical protein
LHLGNIESYDYNYFKAIKLWKIAEEKGNTQARAFLDRYSNYKGKYALNQNIINKKLGGLAPEEDLMQGNGDRHYLAYLKGIVQADNIPQIDKYNTEIFLHQFGFSFQLSKLFKLYQFAVSYTEIDDIEQLGTTLNFILFDKTILSFQYDSKKDSSGKLKQICSDFAQNTGIDPKVMHIK